MSDLSGLIDRFWLWSFAEPWLLVGVLLVLVAIILFGWWAGWKSGNHLVGAAIIGGFAWLWRGVWERIRQANTRPKV